MVTNGSEPDHARDQARQETGNAGETFALAGELGRAISDRLDEGAAGAVVLLRGGLGSGKTVFAKGLAGGLGLEETADVVSPTFTIINQHDLPGGRTLFHVDLYRIASPAEMDGLGLREMLYEGRGQVVAVEWAEKLEGTPWDAGPGGRGGMLWFPVLIEDLGGDRRRITVPEV